MFKRVFLFIATNLAIIALISLLLSIFNVSPYLTSQGLDYYSLMIYALIVGFTGAFISLLLSKWMAKRGFGVQIIEQPSNATERWLLATIQNLARQKNVGMPEVGIYESPEPNAFATGWNKNNALVAVSSGLLSLMTKDEVEGVLGHEMSHVANGDMVTMTLLQGVLNTFVIFFARIAAYFVVQLFRKDDDEGVVGGFVYYLVAIIFEFIFGILASLIVMWFSRYREYRADAGSAKILGKEKMIDALKRLQQLEAGVEKDKRAPAFNAMKITHNAGWLSLFASHPPLEKRIEALQRN